MSAPRQIHDADGAMIGDCESASIGDVLPDLFEASVDRHRARVAIECAGESLTCADLDAAANRWATWLRQRGVRRGMRVAFWLPRSIEVHPVLLGVLKSGAAYVPLDPEYLRDRVQFILENSGAAALVTTEPLVAGLSGLSDGVSLHVDQCRQFGIELDPSRPHQHLQPGTGMPCGSARCLANHSRLDLAQR